MGVKRSSEIDKCIKFLIYWKLNNAFNRAVLFYSVKQTYTRHAVQNKNIMTLLFKVNAPNSTPALPREYQPQAYKRLRLGDDAISSHLAFP